jgi:hypothetical protein
VGAVSGRWRRAALPFDSPKSNDKDVQDKEGSLWDKSKHRLGRKSPTREPKTLLSPS